MISDTDKAYIAGLFDGEGSIHFRRGVEKKKKHKGGGYRISNSLRLGSNLLIVSVATEICIAVGKTSFVD